MSLFISYSSTPVTNKEKVSRFVDFLKNYGFSVIWDDSDLAIGSDIYNFMQRISTDPDISNVLIICNKDYAKKADKRERGVGTETQIITPEIYGQTLQSRFIPIVFEKTKAKKPYLPQYLKGRSYVDFSDENLWNQEMSRLYPVLVLHNVYTELVHAKISCEILNYDRGTIVVTKTEKRQKYFIGRWRMMKNVPMPVFDFEIIDKVYSDGKECLEKFLEEMNQDVLYGYFVFYTHSNDSKFGTISYVFHPDEYLPKRDSVIPFQRWFLKEHEKYTEKIVLECLRHGLIPDELFSDDLG